VKQRVIREAECHQQSEGVPIPWQSTYQWHSTYQVLGASSGIKIRVTGAILCALHSQCLISRAHSSIFRAPGTPAFTPGRKGGLRLTFVENICRTARIKLVANPKLKPTPEQEKLLRDTLELCNQACNFVAAKAWHARKFRRFNLHKLAYRDTRDMF